MNELSSMVIKVTKNYNLLILYLHNFSSFKNPNIQKISDLPKIKKKEIQRILRNYKIFFTFFP